MGPAASQVGRSFLPPPHSVSQVQAARYLTLTRKLPAELSSRRIDTLKNCRITERSFSDGQTARRS